jgi:hypothetical protein
MDRKKFIKNIGVVATLSTISDLHSAVDQLESSFLAPANGKLLLVHFNDSIPHSEFEKHLLNKLKMQLTAYVFAVANNTNFEYLHKIVNSDLKKGIAIKNQPLIAIRPHLKEAFNSSLKSTFLDEFSNLTNIVPNKVEVINPYTFSFNNNKRLDSNVIQHLQSEIVKSQSFYIELNDFVLYNTNKELFYKRLNINIDELVTLIINSSKFSESTTKNSSSKMNKKQAFHRIILFSNLNSEKNSFIVDLKLKK